MLLSSPFVLVLVIQSRRSGEWGSPFAPGYRRALHDQPDLVLGGPPPEKPQTATRLQLGDGRLERLQKFSVAVEEKPSLL